MRAVEKGQASGQTVLPAGPSEKHHEGERPPREQDSRKHRPAPRKAGHNVETVKWRFQKSLLQLDAHHCSFDSTHSVLGGEEDRRPCLACCESGVLAQVEQVSHAEREQPPAPPPSPSGKPLPQRDRSSRPTELHR